MTMRVVFLSAGKNLLLTYGITSIFALFLILPSGQVGSVNLKMLLIAVLTVPLLFSILKKSSLPKKTFFFAIVFLFFLNFFFLISVINGVDFYSVFSAGKAFASTFTIPVVIVSFLSLKIINIEDLSDAFIRSVALYSILKIVLFFLAIFSIVNIDIFFREMYEIFNYSPITYKFGWFVRINTPADYVLVPALLMLILKQRHLEKVQTSENYRKIYFLLFSLAVGISYSRYLWFIFSLIIILNIFFNKKFKWKFSKFIKIFFLFSSLIVFSVPFLIRAFSFFYNRYFGDYAASSDSVREVLLPALLESIDENIFLGGGLGAYLERIVIFEDAPWNYVLQWLSFLNQFGIIGTIALLFMFFTPIYPLFSNIWHGNLKKSSTIVFLVYVTWLCVGFFNTFLLSSSAGLVFLGFFLLSIDNYNRDMVVS